MGTRSLTRVHDEDGTCFFTFYKQHDGYPSGWGEELAEFLSGFRVVNGLSGEEGKIANGMSCLAAQIIAHFKDGPGQFYIYSADAKDCGEAYVYRVKQGAEMTIPADGKSRPWETPARGVVFVCEEPDGKEIWSGDPAAFAEYLAAEEAKEKDDD